MTALRETRRDRAAAVYDFLATVGEFAADMGLPEAQEQLRLLAAAEREREVVVVFAGETSRGKSSLLNALLGRRLLPVDHRMATNTAVVLRPGRPEGIRVWVQDEP